MTTSSEFPEKPRSKSLDRISSFMLKKSSTNLDSTTPWDKDKENIRSDNPGGFVVYRMRRKFNYFTIISVCL